jgi:hypothetical protein
MLDEALFAVGAVVSPDAGIAIPAANNITKAKHTKNFLISLSPYMMTQGMDRNVY